MTRQENSLTSKDELNLETPKSAINRRRFLSAGAFAAAALALPRAAKADTEPNWLSNAIAQADTSNCTKTHHPKSRLLLSAT
ncbi:MAG: hypothetical protein QNJ55_13740 [Xenococcus sp. MO_188.B8]|nr:hypothetical protein [Xenococcus sp. MO_188.B8]